MDYNHLDHVKEVGDGLLLHHWQGVEVPTEGICKLCFVQPWPTCDLKKRQLYQIYIYTSRWSAFAPPLSGSRLVT